MNFTRKIYETMRRNPERELVYWPPSQGNAVTTAWELARDMEICRNLFRIAGYKKGWRIWLLQPLSPAVLAALLALMAEGCAVTVPPAKGGLKTLLKIRRDLDIKGVVLLPCASLKLRFVLWVFRFPTLYFSDWAKGSIDRLYDLPVETDDGDIALISFSSGTTQTSKPIYRTHGVLRAQHEAIDRAFPAFAGQVDLPLFPNILLHHLAMGTATVIPDIPNWQLDKLNPERIFEQFEKYPINTLTGNVYYFEALVIAANGKKFKEVGACGIGGSPVPEALLVEIKSVFTDAQVYVIYGATEAEPISIRQFRSQYNPWNGYAVGAAVGGIEVTINEPQEIRTGDGVQNAGEIFVRGNHVVSGSKNWHRTGDYGYMREGELFLTARKGNESIVEGWQHYSLEHALRHLDGVNQVAALVRNEVFEIHYSGGARADALRKILLEKLPEKALGEFHHHRSLPMDQRHLSKILYRQL